MRATVVGGAIFAIAGLFGCGKAPCAPATCESLGRNCGQVSDRCGGVLDCGSCPEGQICGSQDFPNICNPPACTLVTCASLGKNCGIMPDGCGGVVFCGECEQPWPLERPNVCGGARLANVCGVQACVPQSCTAQGKDCGLVSDGCGATFHCGTCTAPDTCGGGGTTNVCGHPPA